VTRHARHVAGASTLAARRNTALSTRSPLDLRVTLSVAGPLVARLTALKALLYKRIEHRLDDEAAEQYRQLRAELLADPRIGPVAPGFLKQCRDLDDFWPYVRNAVPDPPGGGVWAARRAHVNDALGPAFDIAERAGHASDDDIAEALSELSADRVQLAWQRAVQRREADPPAALTAARSLLETACKHVLGRLGIAFGATDSLGNLYSAAARAVGVHPSTAEGQLKSFLGACANLAATVGELRNERGDSHGLAENAPADLGAPYGALVVNLAGALAAFLVAAYQEHIKKTG